MFLCHVDNHGGIFFYHFLESEIKKLIKSKVTKVEEETPNISEKKVDSRKVWSKLQWINIIKTKKFVF